MKPLPYKDFRWIGKEKLAQMEKDHSLIRGCTLEVDFDVPRDQTFYDYTNCYPLAPEHKVINGVAKLVPNLLDKRRYIVHHSALQTYLKHGLILRKIHRGVSYMEEAFIRPYIELCTKKRQASKQTLSRVCGSYMAMQFWQANGKCACTFWSYCEWGNGKGKEVTKKTCGFTHF